MPRDDVFKGRDKAAQGGGEEGGKTIAESAKDFPAVQIEIEFRQRKSGMREPHSTFSYEEGRNE
jgi:hypothetical protein